MKKENSLKSKVLKAAAKGINGAAVHNAGLQCCIVSYEPKMPQALKSK